MQTLDQLAEKVALPARIDQALKTGFDLVLSISGGKDSDALVRIITHMCYVQRRGWRSPVRLVHSHLGRAEHTYTLPYIRRFARQIGLPLDVVDGGDLVDVMKARKAKLATQGRAIPFWPSVKSRYCTSSTKRDPLSKYLRQRSGKSGRVICTLGLRAEESPARAKKPVMRERASVHTQSRTAYDWLPLHGFSLRDVWNTLGYEPEQLQALQRRYNGWRQSEIFELGLPFHPAYIQGNMRLSCALCFMANQNDLRNGALEHPTLYREYVQLEIDSGYSFQPKRWLGDVAPELLTSTMRDALTEAKSRHQTSAPATHHTEKSGPIQLSLFA